MMINAAFREAGGLADHLQRTDTNETVVLRDDLSFACALSIRDAIADFAAIGAATGANSSLIHISISPAKALNSEQEARMLALIASVYGIPHEHPRLVVMHAKPGATARPAHYHLVVPRVKSNGYLIKDGFYKTKNERISLELEFDFGHDLVPGPNIGTVRERLRSERPDMIAAIEHLSPPEKNNDQTTVTDKNFANQHGTDLPEFDARVFAAWQAGAFENGPSALVPFKITIAQGKSAVMVVDAVTGLGQSLQRVVNRESKRQGTALRLKQRDVAHLTSLSDKFGPLAVVRQEVISASVRRFDRLHREAPLIERSLGPIGGPVQGEQTEAEPASSRPSAKDGDVVEALRTQRAQLQAIQRWRQEVIESRKRAAEKAWRSARIWRSKNLEDFVFLAGAGTAFACGAGLLLSIGAGMVATTYVIAKGRKRFQEARAAAADLKQSRIDTKGTVEAHFADVRRARTFDLQGIPRGAKAAVGHIFRETSGGRDPRPDVLATLDRLKPGLSHHVTLVARYSTSAKLRPILAAMCPTDERHATRALKAFVDGPRRTDVQRAVAAQRGRDDGWPR